MSALRKNLRRKYSQLVLNSPALPTAQATPLQGKWIGKIITYILSLLLISWIFLNAAELAFSVDLPLADTIQPINHQEAMVSVIDDFARLGSKDTSLSDPNFNIPANLYVKDLNYKMEITNHRIIKGLYYSRTSKTQFVILNTDKDGRRGDVLIYAKSNWLTIPKADKVVPGMTIELQTVNSVISSYQVKELNTLNNVQRYVATGSDARQIILFLDNGPETYTIIRAEQK